MKEPKWTTGFVLTNEVCGESNQSCCPPLHSSLPPPLLITTMTMWIKRTQTDTDTQALALQIQNNNSVISYESYIGPEPSLTFM